MEYSLRREPWWNAVKRARSKRARAASQDAAVVTLRLPAFRFLRFFVARVEQSETRERQSSGIFVPGFRCAQSRLRNDETRVTETESQAPPLTFSKPSRVRHADRASPALRGMRRRMPFSQLPFSQQCLVIKLKSQHSQKRTRRESMRTIAVMGAIAVAAALLAAPAPAQAQAVPPAEVRAIA